MHVKKLLSFLLLSVCFGLGRAQAQTVVTIGSTTTTGTSYQIPVNNLWGYSYTQQIVLASEIGTSGAISKIRFGYNTGSLALNDGWTVYLGYTPNATFATTSDWVPSTALTQVYTGTVTASGNWIEVTLATPFIYIPGNGNLVVAVDENVPSYTYTSNMFMTNTGTNRAIHYYSDATNPDPVSPPTASGLLSVYNTMQLELTSLTPCSGAPNAGTAVASATNVCFGTSVNFTLTGATNASGLTYVWQSSSSASGPWTPVSTSSTFSNYTTTVNSTTYYRAAVTCSGNTSYSTPVQVTVPALFPAGTYTIKPSQPASSTNFQTFSAAISAISCGTTGAVVFNVDSATYNEQVVIPQINTNSATNTITFNCNKATLTYSGTSVAPYTLGLNGADHFRFNDLNVVGSGATYALAAHLWNGADRNRFTNCNFSVPATSTSSTASPFSITGTSNAANSSGVAGNYNTVTGCTMLGGYYNTAIYGATATPAVGNRIVGCTLKDFYYYGSYNYYTDSTVLSGNDISRPTRTSFSTFYGIYLYYATRALIEKNRIHDPFGTNEANSSYYAYCLYMSNNTAMTAAQTNTIVNNSIYNIRTNYYIYGLYLYYGYMNIYHNTVALDQTTSTGTSTAYNLYAYDYLYLGAGISVKNNILYNTRGGTGTKYLMYFSSSPSVTSDYNDLYMGATGGTANYVGYYNAGYNTLTTWQGANNGAWDANSVSTNPMFNNAAAGDLKPTNTLMDNRGTPLGVTTDLLGTPRLTPPDVGAFEFGPGCQPVTALSISNITSTTAALKWAGTVGNSGYEYAIDRNRAEPSGNGTLITDTSNNLSGLRPYTRYYAHVRVKCANGGYSSWITDSFTTVCVTPAAPATATTPTICPNQPVTLRTTGADNLTYQWLLNGNPVANARDSVYLTSTGGVYSVIVNMGTCTKTSDTVRLTVDTSLLARVTYSGSNRICGGGSIRMTVNSGAGYTYQWMKNGNPIPTATASTYTVEYTGVYTVRITAPGHGCAAISDPIPVTVSDNPVPQIARNGATLSTTRAFATYQWYYGIQPISGATSGTYNFTHDGAYTVVVTDSNGCTGSSSRYMVNFLGIGTVQASEISVYPNPATTSVTIASPVAVNVEIRTVDGKSVLQQQGATTVDIHGLSAGLYLLYISDKDNNVLKVEKLVKNNH